jgi:hypothetical protein
MVIMNTRHGRLGPEVTEKSRHPYGLSNARITEEDQGAVLLLGQNEEALLP